MPQYLKIAEKIYQNVKEKKGFTDDPMEDLNNLMRLCCTNLSLKAYSTI